MADKTAVLTNPPPGVEAHLHSQWMPLAWVGLLLCVAFLPTLMSMGGSWFDDASNMEHGVFVPLAAAYMVWVKRDELSRVPATASWGGIALVFTTVLLSLLSKVVQWVWASRISFVIGVVGCLWAIYGFRYVRRLVYPLATLILMIAPPSFVTERVTLQLQLLASRLGEMSLETLGFSVMREGNILEMVGEKLAVAEACSGIRSLMALIFLAVVYNFFFVPQRRARIILLASVVPIAIVCNAGRIVATGVVGQYNRELAHGMLHAAFGYMGLTLGAILLLVLHRVLLRLPSMRGQRHV